MIDIVNCSAAEQNCSMGDFAMCKIVKHVIKI